MTGSARPLWERVYNGVRNAIDQGTYRPGDRIPSEPELQETYGVSRTTVRAALTRLVQEGLITEGVGKAGRQVREWKPLYWNLHRFERGTRLDDPSTQLDEWKADMIEQGVKDPRLQISVRIVPAPAWVANYLQINPGDMVLCRRRIRLADEVPVAIADTWVREEIGRKEVDGTAPLLAEHDIVLNNGIFHALGYVQHRLDDRISVRMPTPEEADLLDLPVGSPVGQVDRVGLLEDGQPIRLISTVFPGHRLLLRYELEV
ncbi:GntR family transcriptional regulator [Longimycelium tulufanense]|uniref:GntR family transcriptional regulator n=1 Tax=Longimycelium tulufanense TaxID=907463 RepID=A0A8J3CLA5_9PSEU|nr:GntR family transcriptional regulator [Longimycelium tulufanense]GGM84155.1 GntR family transcriptional regulator [Longimycelium tulufanense]